MHMYMCPNMLLVLQARPNQPQCGLLSVSHKRKGLVTHGRFLCATSQLPRRQSDWLWSHNSELISTWEIAEVDRRVWWLSSFPTLAAHSTYSINGFINLVTFCVNAFYVHMEICDNESDPCWGWLGLAYETNMFWCVTCLLDGICKDRTCCLHSSISVVMTSSVVNFCVNLIVSYNYNHN